ncbi:MAG: hypothetical protein A3B10_02465 [Candidatus Doudnabacteria bacterium RIFCSPLOWO2_01_FULL_44_21]|uniref:Type II secretion system protein GspG C-terminal domain-containing protein n=1 Tax=Candidatus Doudnabacteria bacterium RIFCSPLOWO2_01_FULL_44_21 TaxID=1817841 RepID=A0A1F5PX43_9BACT|nr:MAG: hypothetical protein A3B95_00985 [Candidatus Doudnabacteria bacterium RIFCSPHIGHO2_02_FULL_43_13b]OGE94493.1 MAG: hypothetical protein A3B10_02465 [Candidatus Doudnabacteria bacterium RIFCSPLOWO2_01_FULL_44_21]
MSNKKNGAGFTLIELLVVIAIIGFLAAIVLVSTSTARGRSRDARRMGDMQALQTAVELYNQACSQYPPALTLTASAGCPAGTDLGDYLGSLPINPAGCSVSATGGGGATTYGYTTATNTYTLWFCTEGAVASSPITAAATDHRASPSGFAN